MTGPTIITGATLDMQDAATAGILSICPAVVGTSLYVGVVNAAGDPCILVGTPLAAPVFTVSAPIETVSPRPPGYAGGWPFLMFDGSALWLTWPYQSSLAGDAIVRALKTYTVPFLASWIGETIFDTTVNVTWNFPYNPSIWNGPEGTLVGISASDVGTGHAQALANFWLSPIVVRNLSVVLKGVRRLKAPRCDEITDAPIFESVKRAV